MTNKLLQRLINRAKSGRPPKKLLEFCGDYYEPYYLFMYLAAMTVDDCLVELGCEKGRGLLALALTGKDVIGFDLNRSPDLDLSQYPNITFFEESSLPVHSYLKDKQIGLLHLDTEHSYAQVENEFNQFQGYLTKPAIVIFDDLHAMDDDVKRFFDSLPYDKIQDDEMHPSCGWGVVLYE